MSLPPSNPPLLAVSNLSIVFPGRNPAVSLKKNLAEADSPKTVADSISFTVNTGQTLGLVGESGSGKSATSLAILRLLPPSAHTSGQVLFDDTNILELPEPGMRSLRGSQIAMIFQEPMTALNPVMRIGQQIAEAWIAHHPRTARADVQRRVLASMHEVGLPNPETRLRDYPHQFSGGQRQRILIAMALINRPRLLIADEPTTALDVTVQAQILALLKLLRQTHHLAMLFISHDLAVVAQACDQPGDQIAVMQHGRLVEVAATPTLFNNPQHAYTRHLLASAPTMQTDRNQPLASSSQQTR
jgi:peptide/nickel transport system ATP-binding protein